MTIENYKDILPKQSFNESLERLSNLENPTPLKPENINVSELKNSLINSGIKLDLIENNSELKASIQESQFRSATQGKGPAVVTALGGLENYQKYFDWAMQESKDQPTLGSGDESSKCRGLMQFLGETIALASGQLTPEEYCRKTNLRVGKKYQKNAEISSKFNLPTDEKGIKKLKETSSIPKGSPIKAYEVILSLRKQEEN